MQFLEEEILEITESTWNALLGLDIQPSASTQFSSEREGLFKGHVDITGAWEGSVIICGTDGLARSAAAQIFSLGCNAVQEQDQIDAMYEFANIIAGNIKSLLPEPCQLALPQVERCSQGISALPGAHQVSGLHFECQGQPLVVTVWKRD